MRDSPGPVVEKWENRGNRLSRRDQMSYVERVHVHFSISQSMVSTRARAGTDDGRTRSLGRGSGQGSALEAVGAVPPGPWGQTEFQVKLETRSDLAPRSSGKEDSRKLETFQM